MGLAGGGPGVARQIGRLACALVLAVVLGGVGAASASAAASAELYWTSLNSGAIGRANVDGSGVNQSFITGVVQPLHIVASDSHVYWTEYEGRGIGRAGRDGTGVTHNLVDVHTPDGLAVDGSHVFWAEAGPNRIGRANLDGTSPDRFFILNALAPQGLAAHGGRLYWGSSDRIGYSNVDGTGLGLLFARGANYPYVSAADDTYVYTSNQGEAKISRALVVGGHFETDFITGVTAHGLAVDDTYLYWTEPNRGTIGRAKLDGTEVNRDFITGAARPYELTVTRAEPADTTKPVCGSMVVRRGGGPGGADEADVTITDAGSGIASITNFTVSNGTFSIPPFSSGASSVTVTATKTTPGVPTRFEFDVTDVAGNTIHCR
jgi:virginiamycin B lyase